MQPFIWDRPVRLGVKGERCINGPQDALQYLSEMPQIDLSRKAFVGAAIEASFPILEEDIAS
jgi:hypothetical protein